MNPDNGVVTDHHVISIKMLKVILTILALLSLTLTNDLDQDAAVRVGADLTNLNTILSNNQAWVTSQTSADSTYFSQHSSGQSPPYLWIGCSDSRVPPNLITQEGLGRVFVHRNIANTAEQSDISVQAILQYTI